MKQISSIAAIVLFLSSPLFAADPVPYLKSAAMPFYPPVARTARVQGIVDLRIIVNQDGTVTIDSVSGHPLLRASTAEYVKTWRFDWEQPCACTVKRNVSFVYRISDKEKGPGDPTSTVKWFGISRV